MVIKYGHMKTVAVTEFKAKCLTLLDDVARTGQPLVIMKRGRALARVVPTSSAAIKRPQDTLAGTVTIVGDVVGSISGPTAWHAARGVLLSPKRTSKQRNRR